jgi:hypothetical protein
MPAGPHRADGAAAKTLLRHLTWQLPSGQSIARAMGIRPLSPAQLRELAYLGVGFDRSTPLWYYVLKEAELLADGLHLGPIGGRIVAEVFVGLLQTDPGSYVSARPRWRPELASTNGSFRMSDFLAFAGVDPRSRVSRASEEGGGEDRPRRSRRRICPPARARSPALPEAR